MTHDAQSKEQTITFRMISEDSAGLLLETPYLGVSIDDSSFVPATEIIAKVLELSYLNLKHIDERVYLS